MYDMKEMAQVTMKRIGLGTLAGDEGRILAEIERSLNEAYDAALEEVETRLYQDATPDPWLSLHGMVSSLRSIRKRRKTDDAGTTDSSAPA